MSFAVGRFGIRATSGGEYSFSVNFILSKDSGKIVNKSGDLLEKDKPNNFITDISVKGRLFAVFGQAIVDYVIDQRPYTSPDLFKHLSVVKYLTAKTYMADKKGIKYSDSLESKTVQTYDQKGNIVETIEYDGKSILTSDTKFQYKGNGDRIELYYLPNGKIVYKELVKFDKMGQIIESDWIDINNGTSTREVSFVYDDKGRLRSSSDVRNVYKYDNKNHLIQVEYRTPGNEQLFIDAFRYDNRDRIVEVNYTRDGSKHLKSTFSYSGYDKKRNWLKVFWINGHTMKAYVVEREITYW